MTAKSGLAAGDRGELRLIGQPPIKMDSLKRENATIADIGQAQREAVCQKNTKSWLTFVLDRTPLVPSIQMYSAMMEPFWSRVKYFWSC
jgi:hypothetical protein